MNLIREPTVETSLIIMPVITRDIQTQLINQVAITVLL